jgi:hypothetical protein
VVYLILNDEQFDRLNQLLKDEVVEHKALKFRPFYEELNLNERSANVNLYNIKRLDKHFMLHMFDNNNNLFMLYRLKFGNYNRLRCTDLVFLNKEMFQKKFFELIPKATRCVRLRFEYKIRRFKPFHLSKYSARADYLNLYLT